jgi:hypothetical protein
VAANEASLAADSEDGCHRLVDRAVDRARGEDRADHADAQRDAASLDELADDARLLRGRDG